MSADRVTIRLGDLHPMIAEAADEHGLTISQEIRRRLARSLKTAAPEMPQGFAADPAAADKARRKGLKTRRARAAR